MRALRLALRALRWRRGQSAVLLLVATAATTCAALGPVWARAAEESLLQERLRAAPVSETSFEQQVGRSYDITPGRLLDGLEEASRDRQVGRWFGPAELGVRVPTVVVRDRGREVAVAGVGWYANACRSVRLVQGRCLDTSRETVVPATAARLGVRLGDPVQLQLSDTGRAERLTVVGLYDQAKVGAATWAGSDPFDGGPSPVGALYRVDTLFVARGVMAAPTANQDWRAYALRPLLVGRVHLDVVDQLDSLTKAARLQENPTHVGVVSGSTLPDVLRRVALDGEVLRDTTRAVTVQLVLLADFVLFLVIAASSEERGREVALAKLRGMRPWPATVFALAEPVLLLVAGVPLGIGLGWLLDRALAGRTLLPGTPVTLTAETAASVVLALAGGAVACVLAAWRTLTLPVAAQLQRTGGRRARLRRSVVVDAVVVTLALAGVFELATGQSDSLTLLAPAMLALAAGLLTVRVLPWLARGVASRTRRSPRLGSFLAVRQVARRPAGLRIVVLLAVATALAAFMVDAYSVAARNRAAQAHAEVGADRVLHVARTTPALLQRAVAQADPGGAAAMAALASGSAANPTGPLVAVDAARLDRVSAWEDRWWAGSPSALRALLRPASAAPVVVHDALVVRARASGVSVTSAPGLEVDVRDADGMTVGVGLGQLREGVHEYRAPLPECRAGCRLATIHFLNRSPTASPLGTVVVEQLRDSAGVVDAGLDTVARWRPAAGSRRDLAVPPAVTLHPGPDGLAVALGGRPSDDPAVEVADHPAAVPALVGPTVDTRSRGTPRGTVGSLGLDGSSLLLRPATAQVLPRVGQQGVLVDLQTIDRADVFAPFGADYQVWLSASAGPDVVHRLESAGLVVQGVESRAARQAELDHDGMSLALRLFVAASLAAVALAVGAVAGAVFVGARRREYEFAAVRTLGATRRQLVGAARSEQLALLGAGVAVGLAVSLVAAHWALPAIPPLGTGTSGIPALFSPAWAPVGLLAAGVAAVCLLTADVLARAVIAASGAERLREGQQ